MLLAQLEFQDAIQVRRQTAAAAYRDNLGTWASANGIELQYVPDGSRPPAHLFCMLLPDLSQRTRFLAFTRERGVATTFHYLPLHSSPAGSRYGVDIRQCPNTNSVSDRLVRLPLFSDITDAEVSTILDVVAEFRC